MQPRTRVLRETVERLGIESVEAFQVRCRIIAAHLEDGIRSKPANAGATLRTEIIIHRSHQKAVVSCTATGGRRAG